MAEDEKRRGGGAKPSRTETVTVRLDPKLRYLAELAARKQRRTISSYIEWAVEQSLREVKLYIGTGYNGDTDTTLEEKASDLWDVDPSERFIRLATRYPELLTHEEQEQWKMLSDSDLLSPAKLRSTNDRSLMWDRAKLEDQVFPRVREHWPSLVEAHRAGEVATAAWVRDVREQVARGFVYKSIPKPAAKSSSGFDDMDDEIPF